MFYIQQLNVCLCMYYWNTALPEATDEGWSLTLVNGTTCGGVSQHCGFLLLKKRRPAGHEARLSGEPQHSHQDEENTGYNLWVAGKHTQKPQQPVSNSYTRDNTIPT